MNDEQIALMVGAFTAGITTITLVMGCIIVISDIVAGDDSWPVLAVFMLSLGTIVSIISSIFLLCWLRLAAHDYKRVGL